MIAAALSFLLAPGVYADVYCRLRQAGWREEAAVHAATQAAAVVAQPPQLVDFLGQAYRLDILEAQSAALERCPDL